MIIDVEFRNIEKLEYEKTFAEIFLPYFFFH